MNNSVDEAPPFLPYKELTSAYINAMNTDFVSLCLTFEVETRQFKCTCRSNTSNIAH